MRLSDRYVFGELILPFFIGTLAVLMMLVGNTLYDILPGLLQQHWPVMVVVRICVLNIPTVLVMTLPVSTALAAALATNRMARDNEFTVMRSAGTPLLRAFLPMFVFGLLMSVVDFYISDQVVPWAWQEQQNVEQILDNIPSNPVEIGRTFSADNYTISFDTVQKISNSKRRLTRVIIVTNPIQGSNDYPEITTAQSVDYEKGVWTLQNVVYHRYTPDGLTQLDAVAPTGKLLLQIDFSSMYESSQGAQDKFSFAKYSYAELTERARMAKRMGNFRDALNYEIERWFKFSFPAMCLVLSVCSPPLGLRFARTGTFTGVLLSIITVFVAWNTLLLLKMIGLGGFIPPFVAAWTTNVLFIGLGIWLFRSQE